jgi:transcriptional regulator of met regulon
VDTSKLLPSRADVSNKIPLPKVVTLLKEIANNYDDFWMMFTDYGFEVENNKNITDKMYLNIANTMSDNEIRNFQIELVQASNIKVFVEAWLKVVKKYGTYNKELGFYALMHNDNSIAKI